MGGCDLSILQEMTLNNDKKNIVLLTLCRFLKLERFATLYSGIIWYISYLQYLIHIIETLYVRFAGPYQRVFSCQGRNWQGKGEEHRGREVTKEYMFGWMLDICKVATA